MREKGGPVDGLNGAFALSHPAFHGWAVFMSVGFARRGFHSWMGEMPRQPIRIQSWE